MRQYIATLLAVLLVACGDDPTDPPASTADQLRVINGPATCDACGAVEFTVAGPGLNKVIDASLTNHATHADVETSAEIRHFVGDSGPVLLIKLGFTGTAPKGDYDLHLVTVDIGGAQGSLVVPVAVKVIAPPPGPDLPGPPPGPIGTVRVTVATTGPSASAQYLVTVAPCDPDYTCPGWNVGTSGSVSIQLNPGRYAIRLANLPSNCTVASQGSVGVTVVADRTTNVSFSVTCVVVPSGSIRITAPTTGAVAGSQVYAATVSPCDQSHPCSVDVPPNGSGVIVQRPGNYTVSLGNVPAACSVTEPRSVAVTVTLNQTANVSFSVTCPLPGTVHVTAAVSGLDPDSSYVVFEGQCDYYYYYCNSKDLIVGRSVDFSLPPGSYSISLTGYAQNCSVDLPTRTITVSSGVQTDVAFAVTCVGRTKIRVSAPTTGPDPDEGYWALVGTCAFGPCSQSWLEADASVEIDVPVGTNVVQLYDIASNCTVNGTNPVVVATAAGSVTDVTFQVTCLALPVVRVTAPTTGNNLDASYTVVNESSCDWYYECSQQTLPSVGAVEFKLTPGSYVFRLIDIASNCALTGGNPATVTVVAGTVTNLVFPVTCQ